MFMICTEAYLGRLWAMLKNLQKEMERLARAQQSISVPIESDAEGYLDKECPDDRCLFQFKIYEDDWKDIVRDEEVFCPSCRHIAPATSWYTTKHTLFPSDRKGLRERV